MFKKSILFFLFSACFFSFVKAGAIKVVTTLPDFKSITELIGGDKVSV